MPIKWTAPEILLGHFAELSTQSDVYVQYIYSFGCASVKALLHEAIFLATNCFEGAKKGAQDIAQFYINCIPQNVRK